MFSEILKNGIINFRRNKGMNFSSIFVLTITLSLVFSFFLANGIVENAISSLRGELGITVYFQPQTSMGDISSIKDKVSKFPGIEKVVFVSKDEILNNFKRRHKNDPLTMKALEVLGENPFYDSLNILANDTSQYQAISNFLNQPSFKNIVYKVDYLKKESVINHFSSLVSSFNRAWFILLSSFVLLAFLIVLNTIRMSVLVSQEGIKVTRLIGSSNWFTQGPFIVQGAIDGFWAALITILVFLISSYFLGPKIQNLLMGFNVFNYLMKNIVIVALIDFGGGIGIAAIFSWIAARRYSRI